MLRVFVSDRLEIEFSASLLPRRRLVFISISCVPLSAPNSSFSAIFGTMVAPTSPLNIAAGKLRKLLNGQQSPVKDRVHLRRGLRLSPAQIGPYSKVNDRPVTPF